MKVFRYSLQYIKRNKPIVVSTTIMVAITIAILNIFLLMAVTVYQIGVYLQKQQKISVLFEPLTPVEEINELVKEIEKFDAVRYVEITDSARLENESLSNLGIDSSAVKPTQNNIQGNRETILPIVRIHLKTGVDYKPLLNALKDEEKSNPKIIQIVYFEKLAQRINRLTRAIKIAGGTVVGLLALITVYLIYITMGFAILQSREEIKTLKLIGSPKNTILLPFAILGAIIGALGTLGGNLILLVGSIPFMVEPYLKLLASLLARFLDFLTPQNLAIFVAAEVLAITLITFIISYGASLKVFKKMD